jgi:hypothetical protein
MLRLVLLVVGAALPALLLWRLGPGEVLDALRRIGWYFIPVLQLGRESTRQEAQPHPP